MYVEGFWQFSLCEFFAILSDAVDFLYLLFDETRMTSFKKRYRRIYAAWVVVSILAVISMIFFLIAPIFTYR